MHRGGIYNIGRFLWLISGICFRGWGSWWPSFPGSGLGFINVGSKCCEDSLVVSEQSSSRPPKLP